MEPNEKRYPGWALVSLYVHCANLPIALVDIVLLRDRELLRSHGASWDTMAFVAFVYGALYLSWAKLVQHSLCPGTLIYPFIGDLDSPVKIGGFILVVGTAVTVIFSFVMALGMYVGA